MNYEVFLNHREMLFLISQQWLQLAVSNAEVLQLFQFQVACISKELKAHKVLFFSHG